MNVKLLVGARLYREKFSIENFCANNDVLALIKSGSFYFKCEGRSYTVEKNQCALFKKGHTYQRKIIEPLTFYLFRYSSDTELFSGEHIVFSNTERTRSSIEILDMAYRDKTSDSHRCFQHILTDLSYQHALENQHALPVGINEDETMRTAAETIQNKLLSDESLFEVAKRTGLSYVQFIRRFKAYTGKTPMAYLNDMRLQRAKELLWDSDAMIKEIAVACGFNDEYYFSNFFKKHTGYSPSVFRKAAF